MSGLALRTTQQNVLLRSNRYKGTDFDLLSEQQRILSTKDIDKLKKNCHKLKGLIKKERKFDLMHIIQRTRHKFKYKFDKLLEEQKLLRKQFR